MRERLKAGWLLLDGAMGTQIQEAHISAATWQGLEGCNEWLNLAAPELIERIHGAYFAAGAEAAETNTFGASPLTLAEYGLAGRALDINRAAAGCARAAADAAASPTRPRYVFGSIGPGTKLPSLGQVSFDELCAALRIQLQGLAEGGADAILFETCQDLLQIKAGLVAYEHEIGGRLPLHVSVTVEQTGTLLIGATIQAALAMLLAYPIDILGLNCATGPKAMHIHLDALRDNWPGYLACMPNAGMPVMEQGSVRYPLAPPEFAARLGEITRAVGLHVIGGCCGTTPEHIAALARELADYAPPQRAGHAPEQVSSLFAPVDLTQEPRPLYVGERANATGSKAFRTALLADDYERAFAVLLDQEETSAHVLDLSCAYAGRDEARDMSLLVARAARECRLPLMIDTTQLEVAEAALKRYGGRPLLNSINFEAGAARAEQVTTLARRYGAALVGLTIDETGMALDAARKVAIAKRLAAFCAERGVPHGALLIDVLTFTIGSGDESLRTAALETLEAIRILKRELPGVRTLLGLSNISFGLKPASRKVLNAVFLDQALKAGLDACIINTAAMAALTDIPAPARAAAEALLANDWSQGDPLTAFIEYFDAAPPEEAPEVAAARPPAERLFEAVVRGRLPAAEAVLPGLLAERCAEDILNEMLVPAMKEVGRLFNDGLLQLPFVLKSAEVMKKSVDILKPHFKREDSARAGGTMVIATVAGDVHDIGKNLVDIILSNNGFRVVNLGTKVPIEQMLAAVKAEGAQVLGMSGLLVKSAAIMAENLKALTHAGCDIPVFLGGAALTRNYVAESCQSAYAAPVVYCRDAFEGLARMRELAETGSVPRTTAAAPAPAAPSFAAPPVVIDFTAPPPQPPFWGARIVADLDLEAVYPLLNEIALVRGRWGFRRGKLSSAAYERVLAEEVRPRLEALKRDCRTTGLLRPQVGYGYYRCRGEGNTLRIWPDGQDAHAIVLEFPRQDRSPGLSIPDFFRRDEDLVGFMVVTLGPGLEQENQRLLSADRYQDYFLLHGFAVEVTDALAEYWHARMRQELGYPDQPLTIQDYITQKYRGSRYGFGYPACPDLAMNRVCCALCQAGAIGVTCLENDMMAPEVSTSALVAFHPQAKYFNV
ncbi:MAG: homocysteine S-methyltransferase family protein [Candidatus Marinimicrobia bacterium]|nr:homocysteine S-methyltransferase family protein [Candidatus Neomarinimicrobiota bacterium]